MQITKSTGLPERFSEKKLKTSLLGLGVSGDISNKALQLVKDRLSSDTSTADINKVVSQYLKQHSDPTHHLNYNLKQAIFKLGPTGYPFEELFAKILQEFGYHTKVGQVSLGQCVKHEIDIVAKKKDHLFYIECKFHNRPGLKTDIQAALYTKARFDDINVQNKRADFKQHSWLVSNTKFSKDALAYAKCQKIKATSWNFPNNESLFKLITTSGLHPITSLSSLSKDQTINLLKQNIITLQDLTKFLKGESGHHFLGKETIKKIKHEISTIVTL
jgi:hypothetical protein